MSRYFSSKLSAIEPYVPGEQPRDRRYIKLNTNESPFPPCAGVIRELNAERAGELNLYSDPTAAGLIDALAQEFGVSPENVFAGNGSDEVLAFAFYAYGEKGFTCPDVSYGFYPVFSQFFGIDYRTVPLDGSLSICAEDYAGCGTSIALANPNAQTGLYLAPREVERVVSANPDNVVIVDEAYIDFGGESVIPLTARYRNLLVVGTFSKSRNLAGARIGFAVGDRELIADLNTLKFSFNPYNLNRLSIIAGREAMLDREYFLCCTGEVIRVREYLKTELRERGFSVTDSMANFVLAQSPEITGADLYAELRMRGILVRHLPDERIKNSVRITIGTREQIDELLRQIDNILGRQAK